MPKIISVTDLQRTFHSVLDELAGDGVPYVVTRGSRPEAALIPYAAYMRYQQLQEKDGLGRVEALFARLAEQNASDSESEAAADGAAAIQEVSEKSA